MSLQDLLNLAPVPGLASGVAILTSTYKELHNIKLYKQRCRELSDSCVRLMVALRDSSEGLEGTRTIEMADEVELIISHVDRKVKEWASWNQLRSFLQQGELKEGIDRLHRDIDTAMMKFHIQVSMELSRGQQESRAMQERDKAEIRDLLQKIVKNTDNMKALVSMQSNSGPDPVEEMMECLQTELMDPSIRPSEEEAFKAGLWMLHEETSRLPPLADLTGQVELLSRDTIRKGSFNDVYLGLWLDQESVALRLPRTLVNNPEVQQRFEREISIWRGLRHPNVVPLYGVVHIGGDLYTVSPWMDNGIAVDYIKKNPSADRLRLLTDAASGLEYLHSEGIVHGDLRGTNLLVSKDGIVRLSDFGLSKFLEDCSKGTPSTDNINPRWFAPELVRQSGPLSTHSDVWSFAMVCLEILSGEIPYSNISRDIAVLREVDNGKLPQRPLGRFAISHGLSDNMWGLLVTCWHKKPEMRPSMSDVKSRLLELRGIIDPLDNHSGLIYNKRPTSLHTDKKSLISMSSRGSRPSTAPSKLRTNPSLSVPQDISIVRTHHWHERNSSVSNAKLGSASSLRLDYLPISPVSKDAPLIPDAGLPRLNISQLSLSSSPSQASQISSASGRRSQEQRVGSSPHSLTSSADSTGPTKEPVLEPRVIVNIVNGLVSSGTLEGLVDRLIMNFSFHKDVEYREVLLSTCTDFTTLENVFAVISRRFYEAESSGQHPENQIALQYNIFMVIMYLVSNDQLLQVDHKLLLQIRSFCESAIQVKSSTTMVDKARDILWEIDERTERQSLPSSSSLLPCRKPLQAPDVRPNDLAIALTLLEGDRYRVLSVPDYIAHLRRRPGYNNVEGVYTTNNRIILWIKHSILHYESMEQRADVMKFFIHTAYECRKLRNFSSLVAIATALHSAAVERLRYTRATLTVQMQGKLDALQDIINPSSNHRSYRAALGEAANEEEQRHCIPWLAIHLKELHLVFERYPATVHVEGRPLINFERYCRFMERVREVLYYKVPDLEQHRHQGQLEYLQNRLKDLDASSVTEDQLMERSKKLELLEFSDYHNRKTQLKTLGFRVS